MGRVHVVFSSERLPLLCQTALVAHPVPVLSTDRHKIRPKRVCYYAHSWSFPAFVNYCLVQVKQNVPKAIRTRSRLMRLKQCE